MGMCGNTAREGAAGATSRSRYQWDVGRSWSFAPCPNLQDPVLQWAARKSPKCHAAHVPHGHTPLFLGENFPSQSSGPTHSQLGFGRCLQKAHQHATRAWDTFLVYQEKFKDDQVINVCSGTVHPAAQTSGERGNKIGMFQKSLALTLKKADTVTERFVQLRDLHLLKLRCLLSCCLLHLPIHCSGRSQTRQASEMETKSRYCWKAQTHVEILTVSISTVIFLFWFSDSAIHTCSCGLNYRLGCPNACQRQTPGITNAHVNVHLPWTLHPIYAVGRVFLAG